MDIDGDGYLSEYDLHRFMSKTGLSNEFTPEICTFMFTWMKRRVDHGRCEFAAFVAAADQSFRALRSKSSKLSGKPQLNRQLSHVHARALESDSIEELFATYFVTNSC